MIWRVKGKFRDPSFQIDVGGCLFAASLSDILDKEHHSAWQNARHVGVQEFIKGIVQRLFFSAFSSSMTFYARTVIYSSVGFL